jgi:YVTN family beta-propeller protein
VANYSNSTVSVIDGATNTVIGLPIAVGANPRGIAVNPATNRVYTANSAAQTVSVIDGTTNTVIGLPIAVGANPWGIDVNPVSNRVYVTNSGGTTVTVIDGVTNAVVGSPIPVGTAPFGVGVNPATNRIYVASVGTGSVMTIDGATNAAIGSPIPVGTGPMGIGLNLATGRVYVANNSNASAHAIGIPFFVGAGIARPGSAVSVSWSSLFGPTGADYVGLFESGAPGSSPRSLVFTNGTASPGGPGMDTGLVNLAIPAGLAANGGERLLCHHAGPPVDGSGTGRPGQ